jgi:hypothetical protein
MNTNFQGLALMLGIGFVGLFVVLLRLVQSGFRARGWHELGTPDRPIQIRSRAVSRLIGGLFALAGCGFLAWSWHEAHTNRSLNFKMAAGGPGFLGIRAYFLIEGPISTEDRPSTLGWILAMGGVAAGLLYSEFLRTGRLPFTH